MNAEQLKSARLARWSQNGEARLTLEAAAEWLNTIGFCPYLPPAAAGGPPAASFLEAVVGRPAETPSAGERSRAHELLARMVGNAAAAPLKLGASLGEQPDFVASPEALRYVYALRGDRNWKGGPSTVGNEKVTPLALHCWQAIEEQGPLDVPALQPILGRDITEAAIARALQELWIGLYIFPTLSATGKPAKWELFSRGFPGQVAAGASTGHAESQSAMVSIYLHAVVAAAEEEILAFLSPLAPQSKLREVIRGLGSMRQLDIIDINGRAHVCLQGGLLPEMVAQLSEEQLGVKPAQGEEMNEQEEGTEPRPVATGVAEGGIEIEREPVRPGVGEGGDEAKRFTPKKFEAKKFAPRKFEPRKFESGKSESGRPAGGRSEAGSFAPKKFVARESGPRAGAGGFSRSTGARAAGSYGSGPRNIAASGGDVPRYMGKGSKGSGYKEAPYRGRGFAKYADEGEKPATRGLGERAKRWEKSGEGAGAPTGAGERGFKPRASSEARTPFKPAGEKYRSAGSKPGGSKPGGYKPGGFKPAKPWASKGASAQGGSAKPWTKRTSSAVEGAGSQGRVPEERPGRWEKPAGGGADSSGGYGKPYAGKSAGFKPGGSKAAGFKPRGAKPGGAKPWAAKAGGSRAGAPRAGAGARSSESGSGPGARPERWEKSGAGGRAGASSGAGYAARPAGGKTWGAKPGGFKPGGAKPGGRKPSGFTSSGFKSAGTKAAEARFDGPKGAKPWVSKGAESRVGSAKSYAARSARTGEDDAPRKVYGAGKTYAAGKTYGKSAKPGVGRASSSSSAGDKPKRREKPEPGAGEKSGESGAKKPFWAKNPRGGKGSAAASRTNRPRGKKSGDKKAGKKKGGKKK